MKSANTFNHLKFNIEKIEVVNYEGAIVGTLERDQDEWVLNVEESQTISITAKELHSIYVKLMELQESAS